MDHHFLFIHTDFTNMRFFDEFNDFAAWRNHRVFSSYSESMRRRDGQAKNISTAKTIKNSQELRTVKLPPLPQALPSTSTVDVDLDKEEDNLNSELFIPLP